MLTAALLLSVTLTVSPKTVYIEPMPASQAVNFDLIVENTTEAPLDVDEIQLSVYDRAGKLVIRRLIDGNGTRPSIRTIDVGSVPAKGTSMIFNPFHTLDNAIDLGSMVFDMKLSTKDGSTRYRATTTARPVRYVPKAKMILPLAGRQIVYDGHDFYGHHRRWDYTIPGLQQLGFRTNFMRYSYDFVPVDEAGNMSKGDEKNNGNWFGFGKPVRAAAAGTVVAVVDEHPDDRKFDPSMIVARGPMAIWGNYVVIDHGGGEFATYGHIQQKSARVRAGQRVRRGEAIAAIGASGSSMFPHLHFELQNGPDTSSEGVPSIFTNFERVLGSKRVRVKSGAVDSGEILDGR
jgi:hypothetical protein